MRRRKSRGQRGSEGHIEKRRRPGTRPGRCELVVMVSWDEPPLIYVYLFMEMCFLKVCSALDYTLKVTAEKVSVE